MGMLQELADICRKNLFNEKTLLVHSYITGQNILRSLSLKGCNPLNLRIHTLQSIAGEMSKPALSKNNLTPASNRISQALIFEILLEMHQHNAFEYFTDMEITPSVSGAIWKAIMGLKYAGVRPDGLDESSFISIPKGRDMKQIFSRYETELEKAGLIDEPGILMLAANHSVKIDAIPIIPFDLKLQKLEKELLDHLFPSEIRVICDDPIEGLSTPLSYYHSNDASGRLASSPFSYLYAPDHCPGDMGFSHIRLVRACGENNEVRAVLRRIKAENIPFDKACVYVTAQEPYAQLFYQQAAQFGIPVTFGYGIGITNTRAGRLILMMAQWIRNNYQVSDLYKILNQGFLRFTFADEKNEAVEINAFQIGKVLRVSGIGWGRDRYIRVLNEQLAQLNLKYTEPDSYVRKKLLAQQAVIEFVQEIFNKIPADTNGEIPCRELCAGLSDLLNEHFDATGELEGEAKKVIVETLAEMASGGELAMERDEALKYIENTVLQIRVGASGPKPGSLHLCHFAAENHIPRGHNYILGLDSTRLPGRTMEDPILLDVEKEKLSETLALNRNKTKEDVYAMAQLLTRLEGSITLSYSSLDPTENREQSPSPLLLQAYRLISGDPSKDYTDLKRYLENAEGYIPAEALEENEFWLKHCYQDAKTSNLRSIVYRCRGNLERGGTAWDKRNSADFTCYDGNVGDVIPDTDSGAFSASRLELLAKCPYQYYLRHILHISPPEDVVYDPETWLDAMTMGSLFHSIFEAFYRTISQKGEKPGRDKHGRFLRELADEMIMEMKEQVPPPSEVVFDYERHYILDSCDVFLASEEEYAGEGTPEYFELGFGTGEDSSLPGVKIVLPSGRTFTFAGIIDRVDHLGGNTYRIVDYKSGSAYGYKDREHFKGGRQIQHALYAYAFETLMRERGNKDAKVSEGLYIFPTLKGEGKRYVRRQKDAASLMSLLDDFLEVIHEGAFTSTDDAGDCKYCDYQQVCRYEKVQAVIKDKRMDGKAPGLAAVRRLKDYE